MVSLINIGPHLVDVAPLLLFGAVCVACAGESGDKGRLFCQMMIRGWSISVVVGVLCYVPFGVLNL
jgi:hypothetical protein